MLMHGLEKVYSMWITSILIINTYLTHHSTWRMRPRHRIRLTPSPLLGSESFHFWSLFMFCFSTLGSMKRHTWKWNPTCCQKHLMSPVISSSHAPSFYMKFHFLKAMSHPHNILTIKHSCQASSQSSFSNPTREA